MVATTTHTYRILSGKTNKYYSTSLNMSPTYLASMRTIITGRPKVRLPVASIIITVRLIVMRTIPPAKYHREKSYGPFCHLC